MTSVRKASVVDLDVCPSHCDEPTAPLEALQAQSLTSRQAMIEDARELGAAPMLRIDAVRALQQRWQARLVRKRTDHW